MSFKTLETAVLAELRSITGNTRLKMKNVMEWSTGEVKAHEGETYVFLPKLQVHVCYIDPKLAK